MSAFPVSCHFALGSSNSLPVHALVTNTLGLSDRHHMEARAICVEGGAQIVATRARQLAASQAAADPTQNRTDVLVHSCWGDGLLWQTRLIGHARCAGCVRKWWPLHVQQPAQRGLHWVGSQHEPSHGYLPSGRLACVAYWVRSSPSCLQIGGSIAAQQRQHACPPASSLHGPSCRLISAMDPSVR
jgi:hypothetical protein